MLKIKVPAVLIFLILSISAFAQAQESEAHYLANEGIMIVNGDTKILFDPLYRESYGQYLLMSEEMEGNIFTGTAPYDGIDAIFISHHHGDHFSPEDILRLLEAQPKINLYAPAQAVIAMRAIASNDQAVIFDRVSGVSLEYKDEPVSLNMEGLMIEAVRIPHSGWPTGRLGIENIVWRVRLNNQTTVVHMGDADPNDIHFSQDAEYWNRNYPDMAFPPYWFFSAGGGRNILENRMKAVRSVGIHVPVIIPGDPLRRPRELRNADLFTIPGETRAIPSN
jgi:L-ascorbate metabolism protein UlaG (beta-lactamase superfamily)